MLKGLFKKKNITQIEEIFAPLYGDIIPLSKVPDPVFSKKMMGDGIAIIPKSGKVVSPVNGQVIQVFPTKHAIGIRSERGLELLIHIGLETVELNGEGFEVLVNTDEPIKAGDPLVKVNLEYLKRKNKDIVTPIIITNMEKVLEIEASQERVTNFGDVVFNCSMK
ncbi:PTS glucose transporter subunit IIA [Priestia megaterium]|uniref:PTS glucose transporter subunit IIA n=1 Tax=Priestia megaterium TaxID=1404 RepID=A0A3D8WZU9_PRIMG|nr:PTS glucose transporter subunit IIA [Priestia megaterium]MDH3169131.1 PTS glucose transporter subunit IIA [Priestia megaterium]RDZ12788.1 PTS glucose transporter subunit IIA [Priestia megaterium]